MALSKNQQPVYEIIRDNQPISLRDIKNIANQRNLGIANMKKVVGPLKDTKHAIVQNEDGTYSIDPSFNPNPTPRHSGGHHYYHAPHRPPYVPRIPTFSRSVTLYEFVYNYLLLQTETLHNITPAQAVALINMYMTPNVMSPYTFEAFLEETVQSIQTASRNINVINYLANRVALHTALFGYDLHSINTSSVAALFNRCVTYVGNRIIGSRTTWERMLEGLKDNAAIMSRFATPNDYRNYIGPTRFTATHGCTFEEYQASSTKSRASLSPTGFGIKGFGEAIAPNYLKEIGYMYGKPDTHLLAVARIVPGWLSGVPGRIIPDFHLGLSDQVRKAVAAGIATASEYKLDKILWLICSGFYYKHRNSKYGGGAKRLKQPFLNALDAAIKSGVVIP